MERVKVLRSRNKVQNQRYVLERLTSEIMLGRGINYMETYTIERKRSRDILCFYNMLLHLGYFEAWGSSQFS